MKKTINALACVVILGLSALSIGQCRLVLRQNDEIKKMLKLYDAEHDMYVKLENGIKAVDRINHDMQYPRSLDMGAALPRYAKSPDKLSYRDGACDMKVLMSQMQFDIAMSRGEISPHDAKRLATALQDTNIAFFDDHGELTGRITCK